MKKAASTHTESIPAIEISTILKKLNEEQNTFWKLYHSHYTTKLSNHTADEDEIDHPLLFQSRENNPRKYQTLIPRLGPDLLELSQQLITRTRTEKIDEKILITALIILWKKVSEAYDQLSRAGIAHRDIKPQNIIVTNKNNVVQLLFIDFGESTSHEIDQARDSVKYRGTPFYKPNNIEHLSSTGSDTYALLQIAHEFQFLDCINFFNTSISGLWPTRKNANTAVWLDLKENIYLCAVRYLQTNKDFQEKAIAFINDTLEASKNHFVRQVKQDEDALSAAKKVKQKNKRTHLLTQAARDWYGHQTQPLPSQVLMGEKKPGGTFKEITPVVITDEQGVDRPFILLKINLMKSQTHHLMTQIYSTLFSYNAEKINECHKKYQTRLTGSTSIYAASTPEKIQFCVGAILRDLSRPQCSRRTARTFSSRQHIEKINTIQSLLEDFSRQCFPDKAPLFTTHFTQDLFFNAPPTGLLTSSLFNKTPRQITRFKEKCQFHYETKKPLTA